MRLLVRSIQFVRQIFFRDASQKHIHIGIYLDKYISDKQIGGVCKT